MHLPTLIGRTLTFLLVTVASGLLHAQPPELTSRSFVNDRTYGEERLQRIVVRYKQVEQSPGKSVLAQGHDRAAELNTLAGRRKANIQAIRLDYVKSVTPRSHVLITSQPLNRADMTALIQDIRQNPSIEHASISERVYPLFVPNDPSYSSNQWNLKTPSIEVGGINMPNAWGRTTSLGARVIGTGVTVAIVDTGYRPHSDLASNIVPGYDMVSADFPSGLFTIANDGDGYDLDPTDPGNWTTTGQCGTNLDGTPITGRDSSWHGTRVSGIVGAVGDNGVGIAGVAYGANILPVRVLGSCGGYDDDVAAAVRWAAGLPVPGVLPTNTSHVAKVINLSLGYSGTCDPAGDLQLAINAAIAAGSVVVAATGNNGSPSSLSVPASCAGVIAVTAHTREGDSADYANVGSGTAISAPGGEFGTQIRGVGTLIYSLSNTGTTGPVSDTYASASGTSFSAPQVSAVAALLFQLKPSITPAEVRTYLTTTARAFPVGTYCYGRTTCGSGMLDAYRAVKALQLALGTATNTPPTMLAVTAKTATAGGSLQFTVSGSDVDGDDTVSFTATPLPSGATFDSGTGVFYWGYALPGTYSVLITPTDGFSNGASRTVSITVTGTLPTSTASSGGGGGGTVDWDDLLFVSLLALAMYGLRRHAPFQR